MKVLHVAYVYPPKLRVADGITNVVHNVTKELAKRGHKVAVYTSNMLDLHGRASISASSRRINDVHVCYARSLWRYKTFTVTPSLFPVLSKSIRDFDVVHIHDCRSFQGISAFLFAMPKHVPYVVQPHGSYLSSLPESSIDRIARLALDMSVGKKLVMNAAKVIALSQTEAEQYSSIGVPKKKIAVIPNGIDLQEYADLPPKGSFKKKFNISEDEKIVLYLGRIHKVKGVDILVKAFTKIVNKARNIRLVIVGPDDGYLGEVKALVNASRIANNVLIIGPLYGKDKLEAQLDSDVFVLPSKYETFPISILEAYACGKPVIASKLPSLEKLVINGVTGLFFEPEDSMKLAESINFMLASKTMVSHIRANCRNFVEENFTLERVANELIQVYEQVIQDQ